MDNFDRHWRNINKTEKNGEKLGKLFFNNGYTIAETRTKSGSYWYSPK